MSEADREINLDFMFKYCPQYRYAMSECVAIPEVRQQLTEAYRCGDVVDARVFLLTLKAVYEGKYMHKKENPKFCYASARKIIRELEAVLA